jgi:hypothetical protein
MPLLFGGIFVARIVFNGGKEQVRLDNARL